MYASARASAIESGARSRIAIAASAVTAMWTFGIESSPPKL